MVIKSMRLELENKQKASPYLVGSSLTINFQHFALELLVLYVYGSGVAVAVLSLEEISSPGPGLHRSKTYM
jgi:hypothetical protein